MGEGGSLRSLPFSSVEKSCKRIACILLRTSFGTESLNLSEHPQLVALGDVVVETLADSKSNLEEILDNEAIRLHVFHRCLVRPERLVNQRSDDLCDIQLVCHCAYPFVCGRLIRGGMPIHLTVGRREGTCPLSLSPTVSSFHRGEFSHRFVGPKNLDALAAKANLVENIVVVPRQSRRIADGTNIAVALGMVVAHEV